MTIAVTIRGGNPAVVFEKIGDHLFGAYEGPDGWLPIRWERDGKYITPEEDEPSIESPLDLVYGNLQPKTRTDEG